jgi:hypothetical protein
MMLSRRYRSSAACWSMSATMQPVSCGMPIKMNFRSIWRITVAIARSAVDRVIVLGDEMNWRLGMGASMAEKTGFTHLSRGEARLSDSIFGAAEFDICPENFVT